MIGGVVLLDGATGTELSRRGADTTLPLWSARPLAERPELVTEVHRDWLRAGCEVLTACAFRTHSRSLAAGGWAHRSDELNRRAVACAREAVAAEGAEGIRVAGSLAPLEDCFRPELVPGDEELVLEHGRQARSLAEAGCDLLLVETIATLREARVALRAALDTGLPAWCSFVSDGRGRLLGGEDLGEAARAVEAAGAGAVLVNCVPVVELRGDVEVLAGAGLGVPFGGYGNVGHSHDVDGWRAELMLAPEEFAERLLECRELGATILGGCCGTEPRHLAALASALR